MQPIFQPQNVTQTFLLQFSFIFVQNWLKKGIHKPQNMQPDGYNTNNDDDERDKDAFYSITWISCAFFKKENEGGKKLAPRQKRDKIIFSILRSRLQRKCS